MQGYVNISKFDTGRKHVPGLVQRGVIQWSDKCIIPVGFTQYQADSN